MLVTAYFKSPGRETEGTYVDKSALENGPGVPEPFWTLSPAGQCLPFPQVFLDPIVCCDCPPLGRLGSESRIAPLLGEHG